jgi:hypothetical protein
MTTEARNYLMRSKLLKTVEDITYGISVLNGLLELERTGEVTKLIQEVDKKNVSIVKNMTIGEIVDIDSTTLRVIMNRYASKMRVSYANKGKDFMVIDYVGICELGLKKGMKLLYLATDEDIRRNKYKDIGVNDFMERDEAERQQFSNFEKHSAVLGADVVVIRNEYDKKSEEEMVKKAVELLTK